MKKKGKDPSLLAGAFLRTILVMKFIVLLLLITTSQLAANTTYGQQVTIRMNNVSFKQVTKEIEKQTNLTFLYYESGISKLHKMDINVVNTDYSEVLEKFLSGSNLSFRNVDNTVVIVPKMDVLRNNVEDLVIKGRVTDTLGKPLSGVTVNIKGTNIKIMTKSDGVFAITSASKEVVLVFSFVGMQTREVPVNSSNANLNIVLKETAIDMKGVVVTGYNNIRKESFTGNAISINRDQILRTNPHNLISALQNFDPSFRISENIIWGSNPNALPEFTIRGESSIGMDKSLEKERLKTTQRTNLKDNPNLPIFILDGFEVPVQTIYDMDINRIENVNILKDAAATAMYGSRAANGVLVVTTIAPKPGEMRISYNLTGGFELPNLSDYNLTNASEKLEAELRSGVYNMKDVQDQIKYNDIANKIRRGVNTDWLAQPVRNAFNQKHSIYLDGGVESIRYSLNFNQDNNNGAMKGSFRNRTGAGLTLDYRSKRLQIKNQVYYNSTKMQESPYGNFSTYAQQQPYEEIFDANGNYLPKLSGISPLVNPLWLTTLGSFAGRGHINEFQNNLNANWNILEGLQFKGQLSVTKTDDKTETYKDPKEWDPYYPNDQRGSLDQSLGGGYSWNVNALFYYNRQFNKHFINATAGINARETYDDRYDSEYVGFQLGTLHGPTFAAKQPDKTNYSSAKNRLYGSLASLNYSYDNIYLLDASVRVDGSSQFGNDERQALFWATGVGLNLHNYEWLKDNKAISSLKVRASYGTTGKINFPAYTAVTSYEINSDSWYYTGPAASIIYLGNPKLKWETTKTLDAGFELGLFKSRLFIIGSYYNKKTDDLIDQVSISPASGFGTYRANSGTILNKGFELDVNWIALQNKDWVVTLRGNLASNKNEITSLGTASKAYNEAVNQQYEALYGNKVLQTTPLTRYYVGASTTAIYAVKSAGIDPANGKERFIRQDGTSTYTWNAIDQQVVGDKSPDAQGAFGVNASFRRFYVNASFLYQWGAQTYNTTLLNKVENADIRNSNVDRRVLSDRWKNPGDVVPFFDLADNRITRPTTRFVQDYNFLNFSSLSVGYDFDKDLVRKWKLTTLGVRVNMNDPYRWSSVREERGTSYPYAKNYSFTLIVGL
jgi:TonB-linked SusC/RagA family outer membrane protein